MILITYLVTWAAQWSRVRLLWTTFKRIYCKCFFQYLKNFSTSWRSGLSIFCLFAYRLFWKNLSTCCFVTWKWLASSWIVSGLGFGSILKWICNSVGNNFLLDMAFDAQTKMGVSVINVENQRPKVIVIQVVLVMMTVMMILSLWICFWRSWTGFTQSDPCKDNHAHHDVNKHMYTKRTPRLFKFLTSLKIVIVWNLIQKRQDTLELVSLLMMLKARWAPFI